MSENSRESYTLSLKLKATVRLCGTSLLIFHLFFVLQVHALNKHDTGGYFFLSLLKINSNNMN